MNMFKITWTTGKPEFVVQEEANDVESFVNIHFGSSWETAKESGVTVEHLTGEDLDAALEALGLSNKGFDKPEEEKPAEYFVPVVPTDDTSALDAAKAYLQSVSATDQVQTMTTDQVQTMTTDQVQTLATDQVAALKI